MAFSSKDLSSLRHNHKNHKGSTGLVMPRQNNPHYEDELAIEMLRLENERLREWYDNHKNVVEKAEACFKGKNANNTRYSSGRKEGESLQNAKDKAERLFKRRANLTNVVVEKPREPRVGKSKFSFSGRSSMKVPGFGPGFNGKA